MLYEVITRSPGRPRARPAWLEPGAPGCVITSYSIHYTKLYELADIQHDLFNLGAELAWPDQTQITQDHILMLDQALERMNSQLPPLKEFVLPGGTRVITSYSIHYTKLYDVQWSRPCTRRCNILSNTGTPCCNCPRLSTAPRQHPKPASPRRQPRREPHDHRRNPGHYRQRPLEAESRHRPAPGLVSIAGYQQQRGERLIPGPRITSYNVCYTKLLRNEVAHQGHGHVGHCHDQGGGQAQG